MGTGFLRGSVLGSRRRGLPQSSPPAVSLHEEKSARCFGHPTNVNVSIALAAPGDQKVYAWPVLLLAQASLRKGGLLTFVLITERKSRTGSSGARRLGIMVR